jgi:hypothetical protein
MDFESSAAAALAGADSTNAGLVQSWVTVAGSSQAAKMGENAGISRSRTVPTTLNLRRSRPCAS